MTEQPRSNPTPPEHGEVIAEDKAKQGRRGLHMLAVLGLSIALLVVIYAGIFIAHKQPASDTGVQDAAQRTAEATKGTH